MSDAVLRLNGHCAGYVEGKVRGNRVNEREATKGKWVWSLKKKKIESEERPLVSEMVVSTCEFREDSPSVKCIRHKHLCSSRDTSSGLLKGAVSLSLRIWYPDWHRAMV